MNTKAVGLECRGGEIKSVTVEADGQTETLSGDYVVSSMPVKDLVLDMGDTVPEDIAEIASALPYRDFITVGPAAG